MLVFGLNAQVAVDTVKTDSIKKKVLIEDSWSSKKKKSETKVKTETTSETFTGFGEDTTKVKFMNRDVVKVVEDEKGVKAKIGKIGGMALASEFRKYIHGIQIRINSL